VVIEADETQLKQVFWNLARNAIQSMPDGGELFVSLKRIQDGRARVQFRDTGTGMSDEMREHAFEPFVSGAGGTGLGLSIVYKIVNDHGGTIEIDSEPGQGTCVTLIFPAPERDR
jgi:signal transduction histidine kinase